MDRDRFQELDQQLFDRLHSGSLGPITFYLKDDRQLTGQIRGMARGISDAATYWGRIVISTDVGDVEIFYGNVELID
jgi:hypothetical protein